VIAAGLRPPAWPGLWAFRIGSRGRLIGPAGARLGPTLSCAGGQLQRLLGSGDRWGAVAGWNDLQVHSINAKAERLLNIPTASWCAGSPSREAVHQAIWRRAPFIACSAPAARSGGSGVPWARPIEVTVACREGMIWCALWLNRRRSLEIAVGPTGPLG